MIVQRIQCYHYNEAFQIPFHSPQTNRLRAESVIVGLDCGPDGCGWGESAPRPYVTGEDVQSVLTLWEDVFAPILFAHPFSTLEDIEHLLGQLEHACQEQGQAAYHSALGAAELAMIDALRRSGLLEAQPIFPNNYRETLRFSISVPFIDHQLIEKYFPMISAHFDNPIIKILLNADSDHNFKRVQQLRRLAGENAELRLEVNGKLSRDQLLKEIDHVSRFRPVAIEQPLPAGDIEGLCLIRRKSGLAVVVDESLVSLADAKELLAAQACDIFNIKISKCGGVLRSRAITQLAAQAGIACQVGTHVGESEILGKAGRQLARGIPNFDCYGGGSQILFTALLDRHGKPAPPKKPDSVATTHEGDLIPPPEVEVLKRSTPCLDIKTSNRIPANLSLRA